MESGSYDGLTNNRAFTITYEESLAAPGTSAISVTASTFNGGIQPVLAILSGAQGHMLKASSFSKGGVTLIGGSGADTIIGSNQDDTLTGGFGADDIKGNGGTD